MPSLPSGTVTFLFTDIQGSTRLWQEKPEVMALAQARHFELLRTAIESNHGYIFQVVGDSLCAAFHNAKDGLRAAYYAQRDLQGETWGETGAIKVRMGLHTGAAEIAEDGSKYPVGYATIAAAQRVMSVGHGGQALISQTTAELLQNDLPAGVSLRDMGEHRLKDLRAPLRLYQLDSPELSQDFPALKSLSVLPNNLPVQLTSFIGREREMEEALRLISAARLVTFTGSGGTGKTRLALQVAAEELPAFHDGAWLVELAPIADGNQVPAVLAGVFELGAAPGMSLLAAIMTYLRGKNLLLVLDNCEHLVEAIAQLADQLLHSCPQIKILASSREALGIAGEAAYKVPSLSLPGENETSLERVAQSEAVQLFLERALSANSGFKLNAGNVAAVAQICRRLDGIPLALELAAARARLFPAEQIAARLNDRFRLLTGGSRTALPRQQTLRALIDWSYDLLSTEEKILLRQLSVFSGGWTFEAAEEVCAGLDVLSLLDQLVNKSLVVMEDRGGQGRYHLLETIRQYAREKLMESGEGVALRDRHFEYFLRFSAEAEPKLRGDQAFDWFDRISSDEDNFIAAVEWGQEDRAEDALTVLDNLLFYWAWLGNNHRQVLSWVDSLLVRLDTKSTGEAVSPHRNRALARGYVFSGLMNMALGDYSGAVAILEHALEFEREIGDDFYLAYTMALMAIQWLAMDDEKRALSAAEEAAQRMHRIGDMGPFLVIPLSIQGSIQANSGCLAEAEDLSREIRRYQDLPEHPVFMATFLGRGIDARTRGRTDDARMFLTRGLRIAQRVKSRQLTTAIESELAHLAREHGELQAAKSAYCQLIWRWKELGQFAAVAHQLECLAMIASQEGEPARAARLFGAAEALREQIHISPRPAEVDRYQESVAALRRQVDPAIFASAWADGRSMEMERAIQYAVAPVGEPGAPGDQRDNGPRL